MKVAISLPDRVFKSAERLAKQLRVSRSELYSRALQAFLDEQGATDLRASYDRAFSEPETEREAAFRRRAAREALLDVEW